jgi:3-hydroxyisobutyrate dehydrogenase-like beta-hydroxyacid dehydrogenase
MKLINNFMTQGTAALVAEACLTATRAGADLEKLFEAGKAGAANSSVFQRMMPWVLGHNEGGMPFQLENSRKDVRYYTHLAEAVGVASFLGQAVHQTFVLAALQGESESFVPAVARCLAKAQGVELGPKPKG